MSEPAVITPPAFTIARPQPDEYAPYYGRYISLVEGDDILSRLDHQRRQTMMLLCGRDEKDGDFRYAPGKWSAKELLGHVCDTERIFANRVLADLVEDFIAVRRATLSLLRNLDEPAWMRRGAASKNEVTVRALAYIIAGHELHHRKILEEKYFAAARA